MTAKVECQNNIHRGNKSNKRKCLIKTTSDWLNWLESNFVLWLARL